MIILELVDKIGPLNDINLKLWCIVEGIFVGLCWELASRLEQMKSKGLKYGLQSNMSKCDILLSSGD